MSTNGQPRRGWFAVSKAVRDAIRADYDGDEGCDAALSLHAAIVEVANDRGSDEFTADQPWLARKAGISVRTLRRHLPRIVAAGAVMVEVPKLRGPARFKVPTLGHNGRASGQDVPTLGQVGDFALCPTTEEQGNNRRKNTRRALASDSEYLASLKREPAFRGVDIDREVEKARRWADRKKRAFTQRFLEEWLNRADKTIDPSASNGRHVTAASTPFSLELAASGEQ